MTAGDGRLPVRLAAARATSPWVHSSATTDGRVLPEATAKLCADVRGLSLAHLVHDELRELVSPLELPPVSANPSNTEDAPNGR